MAGAGVAFDLNQAPAQAPSGGVAFNTGAQGVAFAPSAPGVAFAGAGPGVSFGGNTPPVGSGMSPADKLFMTANSFVQSFPEMLGIQPTSDVKAFRAANPVSGGLSQFAGGAVGVLAAIAGAEAIPFVAAGLEGAEAAGAARGGAFLGGAAKGAAEGALIGAVPVVSAATGLNKAIADALPGDQTADSVVDTLPGLALNVVGGGLLGGIGAQVGDLLAKGPKIGDYVTDARPDRTLNTQLDALDARLAPDADPLPDPIRAQLERQRSVVQDAILNDVQPKYSDLGQARIYGDDVQTNSSVGRIVNPLDGDTDGSTSNYLNSLFDQSGTTDASTLVRRTPGLDPTHGYASPDELADVYSQLGTTPEELARNATNVRVVQVKDGGEPAPKLDTLAANDNPVSPDTSTPSGATRAKLDANLTDPDVFTQVGNGWNIARESDGGLFVGTRRLDDNSYAVVRTANPDFLDPQGAKFRGMVVDDNRFFWPGERDFAANIGEPTYDLANARERELGSLLRGEQAGGPATGSAIRATLRDASERLGVYVAPTEGLSSLNPRYAYIRRMLKDMQYDSTARIDSAIEGSRVIERDKGPLQGVLALDDTHTGTGFRDLVNGATEQDLRDIHTAFDTQTKWEDVQALHTQGAVSDKTASVLGWLHEKFNVEIPNRFDALAKNVKGDPATVKLLDGFAPLTGHYGITRTRPGGFKVLLEDAQTGELKGLVGGITAGDARRQAAELIEQQAARGLQLRDAGFYDETAADSGMWKRVQNAILKPGFLQSRGEMLGYTEAKVPTAFELTNIVKRNLSRRESLISNIVAQEKLAPAIQMLRNESGVLADSAESLMRRAQGDEGAFADFQNKALDKITLGLFGKDTASKLARSVNKNFVALQYAGNVGQAFLHAVALAQTLLPEVAYVAGTGAKGYLLHDAMPVLDAAGKMRGSLGALSPMKMMAQTIRMVFSGETNEEFAQILQELGARGLQGARYSEDQFGTEGRIIKAGPKEAGFLRWANTVATLPITKGEEFNRVMTAGASYLLGKEMGLEGADLTRFVIQFKEKTDFSYGTVDKPLVFTTPIGSVYGTLKTWIFNYMANMLRYASGGKEALPALLWQMGVSGAVAGAAGTPALLPLANGASQYFTNKPFMNNLYDWMEGVPQGERVADALMYGLPAGMGLSLATSAASPGSDPARDASMLYSASIFGRMKSLTDATKDGLARYTATGQSPFSSQEVQDELTHAFAPRTAFRALSLSQDQAIRSLSSGSKIMDDVSPGEALLYSLGFTPTGLEKTYRVYSEIKDDQAKKKALVQGLGQAMADAIDKGDGDEMNAIYARTTALGLDVSSVLSSASSRQKNRSVDEITRAETPEQRAEYSNVLQR